MHTSASFNTRPMDDLTAARRQYLEGDPAPAGVRPVVLASWQRSRDFGVDPRRLPRQVVEADRLAAARARERTLLESAGPFLDLAHEALADQPHLFALSDREGLILRILVGPGLPDDEFEQANLVEGASWSERAIGCNGIGTALATGEPVVLIGPEHFQESYLGWTCIGVPIRSGGEVIGALDLSVPNEHVHVHTWGWVLSLAAGIEAGLARGAPSTRLAAERAASDLDAPLSGISGVFDLLASQLEVAPTHADFLQAARTELAGAEEKLRTTVARLHESEERLKRISDSGMVGLLFWEIEGRITDANDRFLEMIGYGRDDLESGALSWTAITPPEWHAADRRAAERLRTTGATATFEREYVRKDGARVPMLVSAATFSDAAGRGVALVHDVSERRRAEAELQRAHALIEGITKGTEDLIAAEDEEFRYLFFNDAYRQEFRRLWGKEIEVGTSMLEALARWPEEQRKARELWSRALRGEAFSVTMEFGPSESSKQVYDLRFNPVRDTEGRLIGAAHILRNVTQQIRTQEALQRAARADAFRVALGDVLRRLSDPIEIQVEAARVLGEYLEASRVHYAEVASDGEVVIPRDHSNDVPSIAGVHNVSSFGSTLLDQFTDGSLVVMPDVAGDPQLTARERAALRAIDVGAYVAVPLVKNGRLTALLAVHDARPRAWSASDVALIAETAERTWEAVERGRVQVALARERSKLAAVIENLPVGVGVGDAAGRILSLNRAGLSLHGFSSEAELMPCIEDYARDFELRGLDGRLMPAEEWPMARAARGEFVRGLELRLVDKVRDAERIVSYDVVPVRDDAGAAVLHVYVIQDLTARKQAEDALRAAMRLAESANQAKADFLAAMSHELRTPLNAIAGYVELLDLGIHGPVTEAQNTALARVAANQRHLLTLINDILQFAKLEAGQVEIDVHPLKVGELLLGVEPLVAPLAATKGVAYSVRDADPTLRILGAEERVRQVVLNLVTNAIKFTPDGGWVMLSCDADEEWVRIRVRDNGPGIERHKQGSIFEPFVQLDRRLNQPHDGVGLGLAISRDLARAMGGELSVESEPGTGSTFTLRLARADRRAPPDRRAAPRDAG
jgi:PAS domain S-box-containing protein